MNGVTDVPKNDTKKQELGVNLVETVPVDVFVKRAAAADHDMASGKRSKGDTPAIGDAMAVDQSRKKKSKQPPRRLPVVTRSLKIWDRLGEMDAGLSVADWIRLDKKGATTDLRDGLRYLHGRKPRVAPVNQMLALNDSDGDDSDDDDDDSIFSDDSDDGGLAKVMGYPYSLHSMQNSKPLSGPVVVGDRLITAIFDSGASVSVISEQLAKDLGLQPNGDKLNVRAFDSQDQHLCDVVVDVPVMVCGLAKPEHMCVERSADPDLFLLGMTWFRQYGITQDPGAGLVHLPDGFGNMIDLRCNSGQELDDEEASVTAVMALTTDQDEDNGDSFATSLNDMDESVKQLVLRYKDCFVEVAGLGCVTGVKHSISLMDDSKKVKSRPYRLSWEEENHMKKELDTMLEEGLIRKSDGSWTSPIFFVKKKGGELRMVIDYRRLNLMTVKDAFPLPHIDDLLAALGGATIFSTLDAASGFWQVAMQDESVNKTGFTTKFGTFEFLVMPFGLTNAPSTFQRLMTGILGDVVGDFAMVFIDDIIIYSRTMAEHVKHLETIFKKCMDAGLKLKMKKCAFAKGAVEYLGHVVTGKGLLPTETNIGKIVKMRTPRNGDEIRSFLGTTGYYRRFIKNYARLVMPLQCLVRKNVAFSWGQDQQDAFGELKKQLTMAPILAHPDRTMIQVLTTDASGRGLGAILSQYPLEDKENETVISYASRTLKDTETRYAATHLEAAGVVWGVEHYRHFLAGRRFVLRTDHSALRYIFKKENPGAKVARWATYLLEYDFEIEYLKGELNAADSLSRLL